MIFYLIDQKWPFIMEYPSKDLLKMYKLYGNFYLIHINELSKNKKRKLKTVGWAFYTP